MKKNLSYVLSIRLIAVLFSAIVFAQETRQTVSAASNVYVISAKAGGVNYVEGKVNVKRITADQLETGDVISTGAGTRMFFYNRHAYSGLSAGRMRS